MNLWPWERKAFARGVRAGERLGASNERRKIVEDLKGLDLSEVKDRGIPMGVLMSITLIQRNQGPLRRDR